MEATQSMRMHAYSKITCGFYDNASFTRCVCQHLHSKVKYSIAIYQPWCFCIPICHGIVPALSSTFKTPVCFRFIEVLQLEDARFPLLTYSPEELDVTVNVNGFMKCKIKAV